LRQGVHPTSYLKEKDQPKLVSFFAFDGEPEMRRIRWSDSPNRYANTASHFREENFAQT
jgi:hypothetical protein